jgi:hypothetical protein
MIGIEMTSKSSIVKTMKKINEREQTKIVVLGCPVVNSRVPCYARACLGGWPGTKVGDAEMTAAVLGGADPDSFACGGLTERAREGQERMRVLNNG